jgi:hypothetical protein
MRARDGLTSAPATESIMAAVTRRPGRIGLSAVLLVQVGTAGIRIPVC